MAKEPENLVLGHLRMVRADVDEGEHTRRFDYLEERVEMLHEGTLTAIRAGDEAKSA